ncbi:MAG: pantoate--beta-alanine ligase [Candidatus Korobacteraceae bacterium]
MKRIATIAEMKAACRRVTRNGKTLGLVPTMGALHEGHLSLVRASKARCDVTAVSIFVNPLQFGPAEDLGKYPRTMERDTALLEQLGADLLFTPAVEEMYPPRAQTYVLVEDLSNKLDGASRPGHFRGVATVVAKLFEIVRPDLAFFGQKDAAQVAVLRKLVNDLDMDVEIVVCPIVREKDGLAMSSRNAYLTSEQRQQALVLYRSLLRVQAAVDRGERDSAKLIEIGKQVIAQEAGVKLDYFAIVDLDTLDPVADVSHCALVAVAAYIGSTRLIDNILLTPSSR